MNGRTMAPLPRHGRVAGATVPRDGARLAVMLLRAAEEHVLVVVGEADMATADQLRDQLIDALAGRPPALRVDLGGLGFCDLSGLDALHDAAHAAAEVGVRLTFSSMSAQLAWLHRTFPAAGTATTEPYPSFPASGEQGR